MVTLPLSHINDNWVGMRILSITVLIVFASEVKGQSFQIPEFLEGYQNRFETFFTSVNELSRLKCDPSSIHNGVYLVAFV